MRACSAFWTLPLLLAACETHDKAQGRNDGLRPASRVQVSPVAVEAKRAAGIKQTPEFAERTREREALVEHLQTEGIRNERVLSAMRRVPRHAFVPDSVASEAYANRPLPIGYGQTISQPAVVASMTESANPNSQDKCLEIGTGSGYQAAVLAEVCASVYSIEYLAPLAVMGEKNLRKVGYGPERVHLRTGDGYRGWPDAAPFNVILVTAAPEHVPRQLLEQLAIGGRLVIPVGPRHGMQYLELWTRRAAGDADDAFTRTQLMAVRFVPFVGEAEAHGN
jgi:protein-L-isoaspartate(D-aspartate) O-methyltransferase